jgi:hypothetical protein
MTPPVAATAGPVDTTDAATTTKTAANTAIHRRLKILTIAVPPRVGAPTQNPGAGDASGVI